MQRLRHVLRPSIRKMSSPCTPPAVACLPTNNWRYESLRAAVEKGGARVVEDPSLAEALVWSEQSQASELPGILERNPNIKWVQLPFAGVEPFMDILQSKPDLTWTCGKGVYSVPVAEQIMMLALAGFRGMGSYARATSWSRPQGRNLYGSKVLVLGGGGITEALLPMLSPFKCDVTVLRRSVAPMEGATRVVGPEQLHECLPDTDLLVLALALTPETEGIIGAAELALLPAHSWIVNLARGKHIDTDALVAALQEKRIGGAGLDVTNPEPLPDGHPLWALDNVLITPHIGNTPEMGLPLLAERVKDNVRRYVTGETLVGYVDVSKGY